MMDLALDSKQSRVLDCSSCDPNKQKLRNCAGKFGKSASPIIVNGQVYHQCPRSMVMNEFELGYMVSLYFDCRENKTYPYGASILEQTAFCKNLFDVMDERVQAYRVRENDRMIKEQEKAAKEARSKAKSPRRK
jgi:hypothetical protein